MKLNNQNSIATVTNATPVDLTAISLEEICMMEFLVEARERAEKQDQTDEVGLTLDKDEFHRNLEAKRDELERTGRVTTTVRAGQFSIGDVSAPS